MPGLFFHETLDPVRVPGAHTRYLSELGEIVSTIGNAEGSAGAECIAAWVPIFLNGDWPRIVTFWEMPGGGTDLRTTSKSTKSFSTARSSAGTVNDQVGLTGSWLVLPSRRDGSNC